MNLHRISSQPQALPPVALPLYHFLHFPIPTFVLSALLSFPFGLNDGPAAFCANPPFIRVVRIALTYLPPATAGQTEGRQQSMSIHSVSCYCTQSVVRGGEKADFETQTGEETLTSSPERMRLGRGLLMLLPPALFQMKSMSNYNRTYNTHMYISRSPTASVLLSVDGRMRV